MTADAAVDLLVSTHPFPGSYTIKAIGLAVDGFVERIVAAAEAGLTRAADVQHSVRFTPHRNHVSVTLELTVWGMVPLSVFVMTAWSNAVNLTDGLDGLAIVPTMFAAGCFAFIAYLVGNKVFSDYLLLHAVPGAGELAVFCGALVGAGLGFLWFNAPPAAIFMGDTGSLALGGLIGTVAVAVKHEIVMVIIGGLFVMETLSVIIQVFWFKRTGRRVFLMAPIHHHFEKKGWTESQVVIRFWIIAVILAMIGLSTLKLR